MQSKRRRIRELWFTFFFFFFSPATENLMTHQLLSSHSRIVAKSATVKTTTIGSRHNGRDVQYVGLFFFQPMLATNNSQQSWVGCLHLARIP